jgi:hypothetical protein
MLSHVLLQQGSLSGRHDRLYQLADKLSLGYPKVKRCIELILSGPCRTGKTGFWCFGGASGALGASGASGGASGTDSHGNKNLTFRTFRKKPANFLLLPSVQQRSREPYVSEHIKQ